MASRHPFNNWLNNQEKKTEEVVKKLLNPNAINIEKRFNINKDKLGHYPLPSGMKLVVNPAVPKGFPVVMLHPDDVEAYMKGMEVPGKSIIFKEE